jgi:uncharacterized protein YaaN involved in tellurite resistance
MESEIQASPLPAPLAQPLALDVAKVKNEVVPVAAQAQDGALADNDPLKKQADEVARRLAAIPPDRYDDARAAIDAAGGRVMQVASHQSDMLKGKLGPLMKKTEEGGPVAQALIALRDQVHELDPSGIDFSPGALSRFFGAVPVIGNPVRRYFNRFETGQGAINSVIKSLENGKAMLQNDDNILSSDQKAWRDNTKLLQTQIAYLRAVDAALEAQIPAIGDPEHQKFLKEEIQFPLRQRIQDLLQRLSVNQQGVLVTEVLIRNNRELVRGVDRALFVTVDALNIAVAAAMALANQKLVLDAVDALNTTTNTLIAGTAARLKSQGAEIQKRASATTLDVQVLRKAFEDINAAIEDVSNYRQKALPEMAKQILDLDASAREAEKVISRMERGDKAVVAHDLGLDVEVAAGRPGAGRVAERFT